MKREQLNKINELVKALDEIERFLNNPYDKWDVREHKINPDNYDPVIWNFHTITINREVIKSSIIAYRDKLKSELKELGYEE